MQTLQKKTTRPIVSWSPQEDDILREQIRIHGTDNWAIIASNFTDKTTRQCRRRWFTYLNSDFKKGGWSPEEDILLCEAQKIFGNRWTEIAKVVSGRTDNAVKNRFSTLCKKKAKREALAKQNTTTYVNLNNKRVISRLDTNEDESSETGVPLKKTRRNDSSDVIERSPEEFREIDEQIKPPFAVMVQDFNILRDLETQASTDMIQGIYLKKDDPKIIALMQQAELLSSLALKFDMENKDQSIDSAWKILQEFLNQSKDADMIRLRITDVDFQLENSKDSLDDLKFSREEIEQSWRASHFYADSPSSSEYSTGSTLLTHLTVDKPDYIAADASDRHHNAESHLQPDQIGQSVVNSVVEKKTVSCTTTNQSEEILSSSIMPPCDDLKDDDDGFVYAFSSNELNSPPQVTPVFRSLASGIPSPQFTESERHFLLKTLGAETASPIPSTIASQSPPCKRALLQNL
ncbi:Transcription factor MYB88 [Heracleum sosnowskyi]|uniref:Transcription factor MYB88 n=1 Tax=Heracleum sosnowskyi TaxID=360622 RepID=A0AAD8M798_9APIA|nr:Transcription factor MYB88 [Heracleum sosnowskyi]